MEGVDLVMQVESPEMARLVAEAKAAVMEGAKGTVVVAMEVVALEVVLAG
jgi:hypothetical protein